MKSNDPSQGSNPESESPADARQSSEGAPSKLALLFRKVMMWLLGIVVLLAIGVLITYFALYQPVQTELVGVQEQAKVLETDLNTKSSDLDTCQKDYQDTQARLNTANGEIALLRVLADLNRASIALLKDDRPGARAILVDTTAQMENLGPVISKIDPKLAGELNQALVDAIRELDSSPTKAQTHLDNLAGTILELERNLNK